MAHTSPLVTGQLQDHPAYEFPLSELARFSLPPGLGGVWIISTPRCILFVKATHDLADSLRDEASFGVFEKALEMGADRVAFITHDDLERRQQIEADIRTNHACPLNSTVRSKEFNGVMAHLRARMSENGALFTPRPANDNSSC